MAIKSFRGMVSSGSIETVALHTNNGSTGYRIKKLQIVPNTPFATDASSEHIFKIYKTPQTIVDGAIDFSDQTLLAVAVVAVSEDSTAGNGVFVYDTVVFDNEVFNQDISLTCIDVEGADAAQPCNYYIELEQIKLSLDENTVATLKNIRNTITPTSV
jgi:hypothetical protein